jgi:4'-phosphopantetheinyl transferase
MFSIYCVSIKNFKEEDKLVYLLRYISKEEADKLMKFRKIDDRKRGLISEILARYFICDMLKVKNSEIILSTNKYGKPFVKNYSQIEYNISHSNEFIVCAIGNQPVGIDIEQISNIDLILSKKVFSVQEYEAFRKIGNSKKREYFYLLWTLKESFIKAKGFGLYMPLNSFNINIVNENNIYCLYEDNKYYFKEYKLDPCYKLSVCSNKKEFPKRIEIFDFEEFYNLVDCNLVQ